MKIKFYKKNAFQLLLMLITSSVFAQPLSGTYTIGGTAPDYPTVSGAVGALTNNGISGPVIFNIRDGVYNEKVVMYQFAGSSPVNTVTFQSENGDSSLVIITDSSSTVAANNYTLQLFGADYITFSKVTIQRPGNKIYGRVIEIGNTSTGISLLNNRIISGALANAANTRALLYTDSLNKNENLTVTGNFFQNGSFGIYKQSYALENGNVITNNIFENQNAGAIFVNWQLGINIARNTIYSSGSANYRAISLDRSIENCRVNKNKIAVNNGNSGLYFSNCNNISGNENIASNNFIQIGGTSSNRGITLVSNQYIKIYHNSIHVTGNNALSAGISSTGISTQIQLINNIFANSGGGLAINIADTGTLSNSDHNDYFVTGANLGSYNAINAVLLADWNALTGKDANSVSADPIFISQSDLHSNSVGINDLGAALGSVNTDIDGDARNATNPDIGADEFTPLSDNITVKALLTPVDFACGDSNTTVTVVIQNLGSNAASAIPLSADISGAGTYNLTDTLAGPLVSYATDTFTFSGTINTYMGGVFNLKCYSSLSTDQNLADDTLITSRTILGYPSTPTAVSPQSFCEGDVHVNALTDSANVLYWFDQASGGNLIYTGNPFSPNITSDTTFYVEAHNGSGSTGCLRITEAALSDPPPYNADHIEIQNCSSAPVNVNGWVVAISNSYTDINLVNSIVWDLSSLGTIAPGQVEFKTDGTAQNPWGQNILWNPGSAGWAIIIDNLGNVVDFAAWQWTNADILGFNATINGFPITIGGSWNGDGTVATCNSPNSISRIGGSDNDDASDFSCINCSPGTVNPGLNVPFNSCGASVCGSDRIAVSVIVNPLPVVNLGSDTVSAFPVTFDAGAGFSSYLWSTAETTQTIQVNGTGTYSVIVTDANGCSGTDSVNYVSTVGVDEWSALSHLNVYPNPVIDMLYISFNSLKSQNIRIRMINNLGETVLEDYEKAVSGIYKRNFNLSKISHGIYTLEIKSDDGVVNKKCVVQ